MSSLSSSVDITMRLVPDENAVPELNEELIDAFNRWTDEAATEMAVELLRRSKAVVPFGPGAVGGGSRKDGLSHPGALQRSGKITDIDAGQGRATKRVRYATPYARLMHGGVAESGKLLRYTKASRQANFLFDAGFAPSNPSPWEIMLDKQTWLDADPFEGMRAA